MKQFQKATKQQSYLRMALVGPSGSGKTYSSLRIAQGLGKRIALIDSERGSAAKYAGDFAFDTVKLETSFSPSEYIEGIEAAIQGGYDVLIIDSLSHAWTDKGGILELHDAIVAQDRTVNDFTAWRKVNPEHNRLIDAILRAPLHIIVTLRAKTDHLVEKNDQGKTVVQKIGLKAIQRDGLEYEFDVVGDLDQNNTLIITKTRCRSLFQATIHHPGEDNIAPVLKAWLTDGAAPLISDEQSKELWQLAKKAGLSVGGLLDLTNKTLGQAYSSPREITLDEFPRVVEALQTTPENEAESEHAAG